MTLNRMTLGLSVTMMLIGAGCGGDDPLTSTWSNTTCFGSTTMPEGIKDCKTTLTFKDDLTFSLQAQQFSEPATATNPGCTTTRLIEGQTWSTDGTTFTLASTGKATIERSSCVNATDENEAVATKDISAPTGSAGYVITESSLIIASGPLKGTYTK